MWNLFVTTLSVLFVSWVLPGITIEGFWTAALVALVIAVLDNTLGIVLTLLTLPLTMMTLGLFLLVVNAILIYSASAIVNGFAVANFWWALLASLIMFIIDLIFN